jgi:ribosome modulation factor
MVRPPRTTSPRMAGVPVVKASKFPNRLDMSPARAKGYKAFKDRLRVEDCPFGKSTPERSDWHDGYEKAWRDQKKENEIFR